MENMFDPRGAVEGNINPIASFDAKNNFQQENGFDFELV